MLDAYMPEPSPTSVGSPLPPMTLEESTKRAMKFPGKAERLTSGIRRDRMDPWMQGVRVYSREP